ncbi:hypothetical protein PRIPAC_96320, partial [Pristionchus pacificus]|uniref:Mutator-like transposase domain-containing protein n=1 Tax=Pristionchus pacificus TaxID=54126 RepID=A0A2A6B2I5_PRIPA
FIELIFFSMFGVMRKKKCFLCGEEMIQARNFPPLSKPLQRKEWILRQDRDDEGTRALIEKHDAIKDPRWCVRHFADPSDSLPIDKRIVPTRSVTIPTVPLRTIRPADLVPPSQFHIEPLQLNNFESRRDDIIADSYHIPKSPTILGSKRDQPWLSPLALEEEYSWNDIDIDYTLSKKFKKEVSTKTTTTIATEGTEYRYSQDSQLEEEDIEIEGEEMENESSTEMGKYAIVEDSSLKRLFKRCEECGASLDTSGITIRRCGSARIVSYHCINEECNAFVTWESQEKVGQGRGKVYSANHKIPVAAFVTGMPFPRFIDFGKLLDIDLPCDSSLRRNMREYGGVAIERVFEGWQEAAREIAVNASEGKGLQVSIDGQYDSPGYTASNCKVTIIDCETKLALAGIALHKDEDGIDGISCRMESEGALRGLVELIEDGIEIRTRVGDQNGMVNKKLREHPLTANIENLHDWWHVQRPLRKEWWQIVKDKLTPIYQQFFNHLYFVHNKYPNKDDRPRALELVQSFIMHAQGKHKWVKDANFQIVTKCEHGRLRRKKGDKRPTLKANSPELELIRELLFKPKFTKAFLSAASLIDTAINECYHSLSLMYAAKRSPHYYKLKMRVSMMHYNSLMLDDILGRRKEIGNTMITRKGRIVIAIKRKRSPGTHTWREEVMEESIKAREETSAMRQLRLIGIPEDNVFDEMKNWWEEQNRMALESGYELEPGEEMGEDEEWDEYDDEPSHEY